MENKVTELFEEMSDIIQIIIILFLYLFAPEKCKASNRLDREAGIYVRESNQCLH